MKYLLWALAIVVVVYALSTITVEDTKPSQSDDVVVDYQTAYQVLCDTPMKTMQDCHVVDFTVPASFQVDTDKQQVIRWYEAETLNQNHVQLTDCVVVDRDNWNCNDGNVKKGFASGQYFENQKDFSNGYLLTVNEIEWSSIKNDVENSYR